MTWLPEERAKPQTHNPADAMAYTARHPRCGHVRIIQSDTRNGSLDDFVAGGFAGLILSREPLAAAQAGFVECDVCREPEQDEMGL